MSTLRRFNLVSTETAGSDISYSLVFTTEGGMYVQLRKGYDQPYKTDDPPQEIQPPQFAAHRVDGVPLSALVGKKLDELLPPKPLEWPDVPHYG